VIVAVVIIGESSSDAPIVTDPPPNLQIGQVAVDAQGVRWRALAAVIETAWVTAPPAFFQRRRVRR
jgi:hypothetical protein